jgi:hypothetical protein
MRADLDEASYGRCKCVVDGSGVGTGLGDAPWGLGHGRTSLGPVSAPGLFTSMAPPLSTVTVSAVIARVAGGVLWRYPGDGAGGFGSRHQIGVGWNVMTAILTPGDVTGDGNADVVGRDAAGRLWLYPGNSTGALSSRRLIGTGWAGYMVTGAGDLNGAGRPDLLARDPAGVLWLYPLSGNALFGTRLKVGTGWNGYTILGPGDVSGDGRADILGCDAAGGLLLFRGNGAGRVAAGTLVPGGWSQMTALVTPGNWDRAGGNDLLARDAQGRLWLYPGNNAGSFGARRLIGAGWQAMTSLGSFPDDTAVPGPVTNVDATPNSSSIALSWSNPSDASPVGVMIRRALGSTPPTSPTAGTLVTAAATPATSFTDTALVSVTPYSYAVFAHNATPGYATAATLTSTTTAAGSGDVSGTVTDAGGTHHGLAHLNVEVHAPLSATTYAGSTAADGTFTVTGVPAATDYQVCFDGYFATGGASDALGYLSQCYNNQPRFGTPTPVTVTAGGTATRIDAALAVAGAVSGKVSDAGGSHHGLAGVGVDMTSVSTHANISVRTAADGSYSIAGLAAGADYQVCFFATGATGGASDTQGYVDQCYNNQPFGSQTR